MKKTKKSLLFSGLALMMSALLLAGTTFAWFTDSVTNKGNTIQAGKLDIGVIGYTLENGEWKGPMWENNLTNNPLFTETTWEPGQYGAILIRVSSYDTTLAEKVSLDFTITDNGKNLADALWYKLHAVQTVSASYQGAMLDALEFKDHRPASEADGVTTMSKIEEDATEPLTLYPDYHQGQYAYYVLEYGMYTSAGNEYQGGSFGLDFSVNATQAPYEEDGFGSDQYDKDATFPATNNKSFIESLQNGGSVTATGAFTWDTGVTMSGDTQSTLNLEDNSNITVTKNGIIDLNGNAQITIQGKGALNQDMESEIGYLIRAAGSSKVIIKDGVFVGGLTCVQAGDNAQVEIYGGHFETLTDYSGTNWHLNLIDNSNASITVYGGTFVNFDPSNSKTENPAANFVADGYKVVSEQHGADTWYTVVPENQ